MSRCIVLDHTLLGMFLYASVWHVCILLNSSSDQLRRIRFAWAGILPWCMLAWQAPWAKISVHRGTNLQPSSLRWCLLCSWFSRLPAVTRLEKGPMEDHCQAWHRIGEIKRRQAGERRHEAYFVENEMSNPVLQGTGPTFLNSNLSSGYDCKWKLTISWRELWSLRTLYFEKVMIPQEKSRQQKTKTGPLPIYSPVTAWVQPSFQTSYKEQRYWYICGASALLQPSLCALGRSNCANLHWRICSF